ncbi:hypothetical protein L1987_03244 [Smallanthus sonchifolius]|uniref:Uncharacterized protein n=1 Tax=Smallanthus sonchifolius TaxID=185202 RepID=A0ACB9KA50_9ASTR|nr:hypothetical protein L1987_03244 [Smallanthus sonchifolius]
MLIWGKEERLRLDEEKTKKMLENRGLMLEMKAKEINKKIETQKALQTEADLLFRFKSLCNRIRPLRENEQNNIKREMQPVKGYVKGRARILKGSLPRNKFGKQEGFDPVQGIVNGGARRRISEAVLW